MFCKRRAVFALILLLAFSYLISPVSAIDESEEIDYTEDLGDGNRVIYYKDGHREFIVGVSFGLNFESSASTWTVIIPSPQPIDWAPILGFIRDVMSLIAAAFAHKIPIATKKAEEILKKIRGNLRARDALRTSLS